MSIEKNSIVKSSVGEDGTISKAQIFTASIGKFLIKNNSAKKSIMKKYLKRALSFFVAVFFIFSFNAVSAANTLLTTGQAIATAFGATFDENNLKIFFNSDITFTNANYEISGNIYTFDLNTHKIAGTSSVLAFKNYSATLRNGIIEDGVSLVANNSISLTLENMNVYNLSTDSSATINIVGNVVLAGNTSGKIIVSQGATLTIPAGKSLSAMTLNNSGTVINNGNITLANPILGNPISGSGTLNGGTGGGSGTQTGEKSKGVFATYLNDSGETLYAFDIEWGSMDFNYINGAWNPLTHKYESNAKTGWQCADGANKITVKSNSNVAMKVSFNYAKNVGFEAIN
ncbi:MAG: hypothetical protein RR246_06655, partial [Clostridia bacterium]